ncbi:hypothetical protein M2271_001894 [Streptomyces sp. LBL]|uniref:hypothetical protein n=1 Tax=Streptomyces sp. LBL TaxID=2940562 RepID=UPI00247435A3|nr:hypothetical protein [Streptomyces sp. LBL]MDH6624097.1 hypothetical protein [Streptomyces sp. LBL]
MLVLVGGAAEAVASSYVEVGDGVRVGDRRWQGVQRAGVCDAFRLLSGHGSLAPKEVRKLVEYALHGLLVPAPTTVVKP